MKKRLDDLKKEIFIFDFDSTFIQVEALEELCKIALKNHPKKTDILQKTKKITNAAMLNEKSIHDSLTERIEIIPAQRKHLDILISELKKKISVSIKRNKTFFQNNSQHIYVVSNGFKEFIVPIVEDFGIKEKNVFANTFIFDEKENIVGLDNDNPLSKENGKVEIIKQLDLKGEIIVIGDGYTDFSIRKVGFANKFYAFTENARRVPIVKLSDHEAPSLDEVLYKQKLPMTISFPKNRIKVLLLDNIHPNATRIFKKEGYYVESLKYSLSIEELKKKIKDVSILGIRSKTKVTKEILDEAKKLMCIGAFCKGVNQIDLQYCLKKGTIVFNAPYSNTRSVVELTIAKIILLIRNSIDKIYKMREGIWDKSIKNSYEIRGKKIGILGYGNIGSQLSVIAEMMGMEVYFYDIEEKLPLGNAIKVDSVKKLLSSVDVLSIHIDGRESNKGFFDKEKLSWMRKGSILLNLSRGYIVNLKDVEEALKTEHIRGLGLDVFPQEPAVNQTTFSCPLTAYPNVILTPHIGGNTLEAQADIATYVPNKIIQYVNTGNTAQSVNFPSISIPAKENTHRLLHVHKSLPGILQKINTLIASHQANILNQTLKTTDNIGYLITEIDKEYNQEMIKELKNIEGSIKFRVLY